MVRLDPEFGLEQAVTHLATDLGHAVVVIAEHDMNRRVKAVEERLGFIQTCAMGGVERLVRRGIIMEEVTTDEDEIKR